MLPHAEPFRSAGDHGNIVRASTQGAYPLCRIVFCVSFYLYELCVSALTRTHALTYTRTYALTHTGVVEA